MALLRYFQPDKSYFLPDFCSQIRFELWYNNCLRIYYDGIIIYESKNWYFYLKIFIYINNNMEYKEYKVYNHELLFEKIKSIRSEDNILYEIKSIKPIKTKLCAKT